jgi:hypothetical protein
VGYMDGNMVRVMPAERLNGLFPESSYTMPHSRYKAMVYCSVDDGVGLVNFFDGSPAWGRNEEISVEEAYKLINSDKK